MILERINVKSMGFNNCGMLDIELLQIDYFSHSSLDTSVIEKEESKPRGARAGPGDAYMYSGSPIRPKRVQAKRKAACGVVYVHKCL